MTKHSLKKILETLKPLGVLEFCKTNILFRTKSCTSLSSPFKVDGNLEELWNNLSLMKKEGGVVSVMRDAVEVRKLRTKTNYTPANPLIEKHSKTP